MRDDRSHHARLRCAMLAEAVAEVADELRLLDLRDMANHIRDGQWAAIDDLVRTSAELSFRDGALLFDCRADLDLDWGRPLALRLGMELQTEAVTAFFTLGLGRDGSVVDLAKLWFATEPASEAAATRLLAGALAEVRIGAGRGRARIGRSGAR